MQGVASASLGEACDASALLMGPVWAAFGSLCMLGNRKGSLGRLERFGGEVSREFDTV